MADRVPKLEPAPMFDENGTSLGDWVRATDLPPAILNADAETLERCAKWAAMPVPEQKALDVFAEAMPELLRGWELDSPDPRPLVRALNAALAAAKEAAP